MPPIVYIHQGYSWYLPLSLRNGRNFAIGDVHYLGDCFGRSVARACGAKVWNLKNHSASAERFAAIYRHHSELGADFELFCIQRWFILADFLEVNGLESCIYLDTDILLTKNITQEWQCTLGFDLAYTGYSAHLCCVNRLSALKKFCDWVMDFYGNPSNEMRMVEWHRSTVEIHGGGGVSDMTMFHWFQQDNPDVLGDYPAIFGDSPFDVSLEETRGFRSDEDGFKFLTWEHGRPSAVGEDGRLIKLASLHHQGRAKLRLRQNAELLNENARLQAAIGTGLDLMFRIGRRIMRYICLYRSKANR
jgi:hypothetical protein